MITLFLATECTEVCKVVLKDCTNEYDFKIAETICCHSTLIALIAAVTIFVLAIINKVQWNRKDGSAEETKAERKSSEGNQKQSSIDSSEKLDQEFIDFCFEMAKSKKDSDRELAKECWEILKEKYLPKTADKVNDNNNE